MAKLSNLQEELLNAIQTAIVNIEIQDPLSENPSWDRFINENGEESSINKGIAHAHAENINEIHVYKGHSSTIKALAKKGYCTIVNIGGYEDHIHCENPAKLIEIPEVIKYKLTYISKHSGKPDNIILYAYNVESIKKYIERCQQPARYLEGLDITIEIPEQTHKVVYSPKK